MPHTITLASASSHPSVYDEPGGGHVIAVEFVAQIVEQGGAVAEIGMLLVELPQNAQPRAI